MARRLPQISQLPPPQYLHDVCNMQLGLTQNTTFSFMQITLTDSEVVVVVVYSMYYVRPCFMLCALAALPT